MRDVQLTFFIRPPAPDDPTEATRQRHSFRVNGKGTGPLECVEAALPARGSLAPLLHAFGLLPQDSLWQLTAQETSSEAPQPADAPLMERLQQPLGTWHQGPPLAQLSPSTAIACPAMALGWIAGSAGRKPWSCDKLDSKRQCIGWPLDV